STQPPDLTKSEHWMNFGIGRTGFNLQCLLNSKEKWIGVYLYFKSIDTKAHFELLRKECEKIEQQLGTLEWKNLPEKKSSRIGLRRLDSDPMIEADWPRQISWVVENLQAFNKTFRPLVKSLEASEWHPDDESDV
ncbi:MAG: DUF4268 domain-containing protein, partial [Bryobacterales bacterium]|nr:DUF4268 domain-containing protein [Bryobacterales bacterium]